MTTRQIDTDWNNSKLYVLQQCPEKFRRRYIEGERIPGTARQKRGTAAHAVAAEAHKRQLAAKRQALGLSVMEDPPLGANIDPAILREALPSVEEASDIAADTFEREWAAGVTLTDEEAERGAAAVGGEAKDFAVDIGRTYVRGIAPTINPLGVERKIVVRPQGSDLAIHGTMDLISEVRTLGEEPAEEVRDLKTSERAPRQSQADDSQQLSMYAMLRWAEVGRMPRAMTLDYVVRTPKTHRVSYVALRTTRDEQDIAVMVARINAAVDSVRKGAFIPTNPDNWWCGPKWCEFFTTCRYVRGGGRRAS